jgi:quercetin dioxygenase-like cupin family protein
MIRDRRKGPIMPEASDDRVIRFLGNNEIKVLVSGTETDDAYCMLELITQPRGGATALHTDSWVETFYVLDGEVEWTLEKDGGLVTWLARRGDAIVVPQGAKHRFAGAGDGPSRMLAVGVPRFEQFFRALAAAWPGPYDKERTPAAVGPVFEAFGMRLCAP